MNLEISVKDLSAIKARNPFVVILDVREGWELEKASLSGTLHIPLGELMMAKDQLPKDLPLYVLCHHGVRSLKAALWLGQEGYEAYSVKGGIHAWAHDIDPSVGIY